MRRATACSIGDEDHKQRTSAGLKTTTLQRPRTLLLAELARADLLHTRTWTIEESQDTCC